MFECMECGRKFKSVKAAERAGMNGCPKCGSVDVDIAPASPEAKENWSYRQMEIQSVY